MPTNYYQEILGCITNIEDAKDGIASAIEAKGVTVSSDASLGDYPALIANIPTGSGDASTKYGILCQSGIGIPENNECVFNTGYIPTYKTGIKFDYCGIDANYAHVVCGCDSSSADTGIFKVWTDGEGGFHVDRNTNGTKRLSWTEDFDGWYNIDIRPDAIYHYDEEKVSSPGLVDSTWTCNAPIAYVGTVDASGNVFSAGQTGGLDLGHFQIYEYEYDSDSGEYYEDVKRDFYPAYDASDNFCLYDIITHVMIYPTGQNPNFSGTKMSDPYIYELSD